ncbi:MAG: UPF0179 family protein [Candidatus Thermoplasmatota archaeon]|nr:UPF0179 family protein [Candidatus Thermoplasmatota archaeon]
MARITLYRSAAAREGTTFTYIGQAPECAECKVRAICHSLEEGHVYRITALRDKEHDCAVHEGDKVRVVEYEEMPLEIAVPVKKAMEGAIITLDGSECTWAWCASHGYCRRTALPEGARVRILSLGEDLECAKGAKLKRAVVEIEG